MIEPQKFNEFERWCKTEPGVKAINSFYYLRTKLDTMLENDLTGCALRKTECILNRSKHFSHYYLDLLPILDEYDSLHSHGSNVEICLSVGHADLIDEVNLQIEDIKKCLRVFVDNVIQDLKGYCS